MFVFFIPSEDDDEIVECDNCGVAVHEGCYGISDNQSIASTESSASTEPWYCDACKAGVKPVSSLLLIRITCLYNIYSLIPHQENMSVYSLPPQIALLYSETGVCRGIPIFLIFAPKHRLWVLVRTASNRKFSFFTTLEITVYCMGEFS